MTGGSSISPPVLAVHSVRKGRAELTPVSARVLPGVLPNVGHAPELVSAAARLLAAALAALGAVAALSGG